MRVTTEVRFAPAIAAALLLAVACADSTSPPRESVLTGLSRVESNDTLPSVPPVEGPATPGSFHGFVLGFGTGPDTMATAPRLQGVVVTAYPHLGWEGTNPVVGNAVATRTTDEQGAFQFPTIAGGDYIITFVPPPASDYRATFTPTRIHEGSNEGSWWIFAPLK